MDFLRANSSLVLVGIWNPAILNPSWLARWCFGVAEGVDLPVQVEIGVPAVITPRYTINGILFAPSRTNLVLQPAAPFTVEKFHQIESLAIRVLTNLPHTPISAFGFNFDFLEPTPTAEQLDVFTKVQDLAALDFVFETQETRIYSSIMFEGRVLNLNRSHKNGQLSIKFNFHYAVTSAEDARNHMRGENSVFVENFGYVRRVLNSLYNLQDVSLEANA
jgi:hypothetical protein